MATSDPGLEYDGGRRRRAARRWPAPLLLAAVALLVAAACERSRPPAPATAADGAGGAAIDGGPDVYVVRGQVLALPDPEDPEGTFSVRHEAIDDFRGVGGEIWGMDSMAMPFPLADGVSLEGIEVGDKIRFTLEVDHYRDVPMRVTAVEELPADAELDFRPARPPPAAEG